MRSRAWDRRSMMSCMSTSRPIIVKWLTEINHQPTYIHI